MDSKEEMQKTDDILSGILDQLRGLATKDMARYIGRAF